MALIIDTDIGSDIDDAIAIAYAIKSGIDIKLISTVHGPVKTRANIAKHLTTNLGKDIPVAIGESNPIKQRHMFLSGFEEKKYYVDAKYELMPDAVDALADTIFHNRNNIEIAAIGPLTNIAKTIQKHPFVKDYVEHIYVMGNANITSDNYFLNFRAHNLKVDPEAADIVFDSEIPITIVTTPVCKQNYFTKEEMESLGKEKGLEYIASAGLDWIKNSADNVSYLYDPLAIQHYLDYFVTTKVIRKNVRITTGIDMNFSKEVLGKLKNEYTNSN